MGRSEIGKMGALARMGRYGNPGTAEGRRLGGLRSLKSKKRAGTNFKLLKHYPTPRNSIKLAELLGILAGDGHVGKYQTSITTNAVTDLEHARYTKSLFESLFPVKASLRFKKDSKACEIVVSSKHIGIVLVKKGMVQGHKIRSSLCIPSWVKKNAKFRRAFIRGLFDTDGSVYVDKHSTKGKTYENLCMIFSNRCQPLLEAFKEALETEGLHPTQKTEYALFLRRKEEIRRYFKGIGSSNPKHLNKVREHLLQGGVA